MLKKYAYVCVLKAPDSTNTMHGKNKKVIVLLNILLMGIKIKGKIKINLK